ncbi:MAG: hypothetical protein ACK5FV_11785, partial [Bacteroidota bacterium]
MYKQIFIFLLLCFSTRVFAQCITGDCQNGIGTYLFPSGAKYTGHFKNGEINGVGVCYYTNNSKYQGEWANRYPEGKGTKTYSDGTVRTGLWKKGKPVDENGNLQEEYVARKKEERSDDGTNIQSGCLSGDCQNGTGIFAYPDGSKYDGNFLNGKFDGEGTFYFANGDVYSGGFRENYPDGKGTRILSDSTRESGDWRQGEFLGRSLVEMGRTGCLEGDCTDGQGVFVYKEGSAKYSGQFKGGMPHGYGTCVYANGDIYAGNWVEGAFEGPGILTLRDKTEVDGYWKAGEYMGREQPSDTADTASEPVAAAPPVQIVSPKAKVWAVVCGVATYDHMPVLRYTDDDAYRFYAFLKSPEGGALPDDQIRVLIDEDATHENILENISQIFGMAGPDDLVVFLLSGHRQKGSFQPKQIYGYNNKHIHQQK